MEGHWSGGMISRAIAEIRRYDITCDNRDRWPGMPQQTNSGSRITNGNCLIDEKTGSLNLFARFLPQGGMIKEGHKRHIDYDVFLHLVSTLTFSPGGEVIIRLLIASTDKPPVDQPGKLRP